MMLILTLLKSFAKANDEAKKKRKLIKVEFTDEELRARGIDPEGVCFVLLTVRGCNLIVIRLPSCMYVGVQRSARNR